MRRPMLAPHWALNASAIHSQCKFRKIKAYIKAYINVTPLIDMNEGRSIPRRMAGTNYPFSKQAVYFSVGQALHVR